MAVTTHTAAVVVFIVTTAVFSCAWAHAPAPGPSGSGSAAGPSSMDCITSLLNMSDCVPYAELGSNLTKPDKTCCPELAGLVEGAPQCLCYLLDGKTAKQFGIDIDLDRALKLPSVCGVATPPTSMCSLMGIPVQAPAGAPGASDATGSAPSGSRTVSSPTTGSNDSTAGASSLLLSSPPLVVLPIGLLFFIKAFI